MRTEDPEFSEGFIRFAERVLVVACALVVVAFAAAGQSCAAHVAREPWGFDRAIAEPDTARVPSSLEDRIDDERRDRADEARTRGVIGYPQVPARSLPRACYITSEGMIAVFAHGDAECPPRPEIEQAAITVARRAKMDVAAFAGTEIHVTTHRLLCNPLDASPRNEPVDACTDAYRIILRMPDGTLERDAVHELGHVAARIQHRPDRTDPDPLPL